MTALKIGWLLVLAEVGGTKNPVTRNTFENSDSRAGGESGFGGQAFGKLWQLLWIG